MINVNDATKRIVMKYENTKKNSETHSPVDNSDAEAFGAVNSFECNNYFILYEVPY